MRTAISISRKSASYEAPAFQRKLRVGSTNDSFEREADSVADQVMRMPEPSVQRKCAGCEEEENRVRRKESVAASGPATAPQSVHEAISGGGRPLDPSVRSFMEPRFGHDFGDVRIHTGSRAAASARSVNAFAYTVGRDMVFGEGAYRPQTESGRRLIAHELTHVIQQGERSGKVRGDAGPDKVSRRHGSDGVLSRSVKPQAPASCGTFAVNMTPFTTGSEGTIEFQPDAKKCPTCNLIRLVQVVRVFEKPGQDYKWSGGEAPRENVKTTEDKTKGVNPNFFVDHLASRCTAGTGCSIYYRDHAAHATKSQDGSNDGTTAKKASLWDRPQGDADDVFEFETCARCHDDGSYMGCVTWGFTADSAGSATMSATGQHGAPSATFLAAVSKFNTYYANK